jgi:ribonuclease Z
MGLLGRTQDLHLFAPGPLKEIFDLQLQVADTKLPYPLHFHPLEEEGVLVRDSKFEVSCFRVYHRIICWGFIFRQVKAPRKVNPAKAIELGVPASFFDRLKWAEDYTNKDGIVISNELVTDPAPRPRSYAYAADTSYNEIIADKVRGVDLLYHEATYLKDLAERAEKRFHSTCAQAATIALKAQVRKLIIGHFSSKYEKLDEFEQQAREIFPNTELALEGVTYRVG